MTPSYNQKEHVLHLIYESFDQVLLEDGVSLHETIEIDNYGATDKEKAQIKNDERKDWKKLIDDPELEKIHGIGGLCFYDAKGLRFHLPAYMCLTINKPHADVTESLMFTLTHLEAYNQERFAILTIEQRKAIKVFLTYARYNTGFAFEYNFAAIEAAIRDYWGGVAT